MNFIYFLMFSHSLKSSYAFFLVFFLAGTPICLFGSDKYKKPTVYKDLAHKTPYESEIYCLNKLKEINAHKSELKEFQYARSVSYLYYTLGKVNLSRGDYKQANMYYAKLDSIGYYYYGSATPLLYSKTVVGYWYLESLEDQAEIMIETGDLIEAKKLIDKNSIARASLEKFDPGIVRTYNTLGHYYSATRQYDSSIYYYTKFILYIHNNYFNPSSINLLGNSYTQLAHVYLLNNNPKEALSFAKKGYRINTHRWAKKWNQNSGNELIVSANTVAEIYRMTGDLSKAKKWNTIAYNHYHEAGSQASPQSLQVLTTRALLCWTDNDTDSASAYFSKATKNYFTFLYKNFTYLSEHERVYFYNNSKYHIEYAKAFYYSELQKNPSDSIASKKLYELNLNTKGILLNSSLAFMDKIYASGNPEVVLLFNELKELKNRLSYTSNTKNTTSTLQESQALFIQIEQKEKALQNLLDIQTEEYITQDMILSSIPDQFQLVDIMKGHPVKIVPNAQGPILNLSDSSVYIYFVSDKTRSTFTVSFNSNGTQLDTKMFNLYRNALKFNLQRTDLYSAYWGCIEAQLVYSDILLSTDGIYNMINPNILYNGTNHLIGQHNIYSIVSAKDLLHKNSVQPTYSSVLLMGRPDFSGYTKSFDDQDRPADLPGTEKEIHDIQSVLPKHINCRLYIGKEANEAMIKNVSSASIIHFATHGYFDSDDSRNPLLNSGLLLTIPDSSKEDGVLTAYEASNLDLDSTYLVVLSACETGLGESIDGDGVWGLQRSFQLAGVNYIIMSLVKVNDDITALLMTEFYKNLINGQPVFNAFKNAELKIKTLYEQPKYWGAFILKGY